VTSERSIVSNIVDDLLPLAFPVERLSLLPGNPRRGDVAAVAKSYETFGQRKPVVARRQGDSGVVLAGNHQLQAARSLGWSHIAVVWVDDDDRTAAAFALADNRTSNLGDYDDELLAEMLQSVADDSLLMEATAYTVHDLEDLLRRESGTPPPDLEFVPPEHEEVTTERGDVWLLGPHRVICGDARAPEDVERLMSTVKANLAFTSPPYASQRKYDEESDFRPIPEEAYVEWFKAVADIVAGILSADGSWFVNIKASSHDGQRGLYTNDLLAAHVRDWGWRFVDEFCWVDTKNGVPGAWPNRFKNAWEPIFHFTRQAAIKFFPMSNGHQSSHVFDYVPGRPRSMTGSGMKGETHETYEGLALPSNVLHIASASLVHHPAPFPVALPAWFIRAFSESGDVVYDPFLGSGSTLIAADSEGRICYGMELSPKYVDLICRRYWSMTGRVPVNESTGEFFPVAD